MNVLTRKDVKWQWEQEQQKVFDKLKGIFTTRLVLAAPDLDKEFRVEADASNYATCYESPREERVSHTFKHLISNIKSYNGVKI